MPEYHKLKRNPFVEKFDHDLIGAERKKLIRDLVNVVDRSVRDAEPILSILQGGYGEGKSFTLRKMKEAMSDPARFSDLASSGNQRKVATALITASQATPPRAYTPFFYSEAARDLTKSFLLGVAERATAHKAWDTAPIADEYRSALQTLAEEGDAPLGVLATRWLQGNKLSKGDMSNVGVWQPIADERSGREALVSLLVATRLAGFDGVVILVDEVEYLFHAGQKKALECLTAMKHMYDKAEEALSDHPSLVAPLTIVLSIAPRTWEEITELGEEADEGSGGEGLNPLLRRIKEDRRFRLSQLSIEDTQELLEHLLQSARSRPIKNPLKPLNADVVRWLHEHANGIPGFILEYARIILERADEEKLDTIPSEIGNWLGESDAESTGEEFSQEIEEDLI